MVVLEAVLLVLAAMMIAEIHWVQELTLVMEVKLVTLVMEGKLVTLVMVLTV